MAAVFQAAGAGDGVDDARCAAAWRADRVQAGAAPRASRISIRRFGQAKSLGDRVDRLGELKFADVRLHIPSVANRATGKSMGEHCEEMAQQWNIARADQDRIALQSHQRAVKAMAAGFFDDLGGAGGRHRRRTASRAPTPPRRSSRR
jgi:acetyl-CoA C-acetyltransferase